MKTILITGASSGIGFECAMHLHDAGYKVIGTSRSTGGHFLFEMIQLDVADQSSINQALKNIDHIDVLINNAGMGICGKVLDSSREEIEKQFNVNFFGQLNMIKAVRPKMTAGGLIINISSVAGFTSLPYQGVYSASKFALEGLSRALRMELIEDNIDLVSINPGDFKTSFTNNRHIVDKYQDGGDETFKRVINTIRKDEKNGSDPEQIAKLVYKIINSDNRKVNYVVGTFVEKLFVFLSRLLPSKWIDKILMDHYKM